jgi:CheY-like chemotaxis protein/two-component sensor histidine kinase
MLNQGAALSPERTRHALEVIGRNAALQTQLIEDILDVTRIIAGKLAVERQPVLLPPLLDTVVSTVLPAANAKQIQLSREVPENLAAVEADPKRLHQVLANILSNAIKFTPEGGRVHVTCGVDTEWVLIEVRDSGIGIAADFLPFVFDRFSQADSRFARTHGGLGLGLAIAHHLIEQHGGDIRACSDGPGCGTTVSIRLPVGASARSGTAVSRFASAGTLQGLTHLQMDGVKVLVVDDDEDSRKFLVALFDQCGADVRQCDSAASTLDLLASTSVDLIVADLGMPHVDGYQLIQQVRQMGDAHCRIPAVAVSAYARPEDRERAFAAGYNGYSSKPLETPVLLLTIDGVLKASAARADS